MIAHFNPEQRRNITKLATYLEALPLNYVHFGMEHFLENVENDDAEAYALRNGGLSQFECGAVACAVGHGPAAGILFRADEIASYGPRWGHYSQRLVDTGARRWLWCFSGSWDAIDNTHRGAAARIRYLLAGRALPKAFVTVTPYEVLKGLEDYDVTAEDLRATYAKYLVTTP